MRPVLVIAKIERRRGTNSAVFLTRKNPNNSINRKIACYALGWLLQKNKYRKLSHSGFPDSLTLWRTFFMQRSDGFFRNIVFVYCQNLTEITDKILDNNFNIKTLGIFREKLQVNLNENENHWVAKFRICVTLKIYWGLG